MAQARSAGILLYRFSSSGGPEVLIAHMGGPFWARRDAGAWTIPKGEYGPDEDPRQAALREFAEELGRPIGSLDLIELGDIRQSGGKLVTGFAAEGDFDVDALRSNTFTTEWPRGSGRMREFPEIDRVAWVDLATAREKLVRGQVMLLDRLAHALKDA